jgi:hypothetical protein
MELVWAPGEAAQSRSAAAVSSGPLSQRKNSGKPCTVKDVGQDGDGDGGVGVGVGVDGVND